MSGRGGRGRSVVLVAAGLVVLLGADPGLLGAASSWAAEPTGVIDESRSDNLAVAAAGLPAETAAPDTPLRAEQPDPVDPLVGLDLPDSLPGAAEQTVDLVVGGSGEPVSVPVDLGGLPVTVAPVAGASSPERVALSVLGQAAVEQAGITGVVIGVEDVSETPVAVDQVVELSVPFDGFAGIGGGDWADRVQAVWIPDCDPVDEAAPECLPAALGSTVDPVAQTVTVTVPVGAADTAGAAPASVPASVAGPVRSASVSAGSGGGSVGIGSGLSGQLGDWSASPLAPSSTWGTSGATGAFTWTYPMRVPQVPAGPVPELSLSYSSAVSDGRIASTNNQSGVIGEGFDLGASFIERTYTSCADDEAGGANNVGLSAPDLCWGVENATLSLNGAGSELIKDSAPAVWHPRRDDGTRVEQVADGGAAGEYWKVTTTDGVQYFFGQRAGAGSAWTVPVYGNHAGEPGHAAGFADSSREQVWRWNLDRVVDPSGNTAEYFYTTERNLYRPFYGDAAVSYVSGGYLDRVEYGTHPDNGVDAAPAKVVFTHTPRCITDIAVPDSWCAGSQSSTTANRWPDTPVDLICTGTPGCATYAPTFFNRTRLAKITTYVSDGSGYQPVDSWALTQRFVPQGDGVGLQYATGIMLRLDAVTHTGMGGTRDDVTLPAVQFDYTALANQVVNPDSGADGLWRHRVTSVRTESGGRISVTYTTSCAAPTADPGQNTSLCFPIRWHRPGEPQPRTDYFYKYVVASIVEGHTNREASSPELITGSLAVTTRYDYTQAAWKWVKPDTPLIDEADKTYSEFRGAKQITTIVGELDATPTSTVTRYYRGAGETLTAPVSGIGDVTDHARLAGEVFTSTQLNGTTKVAETIRTFGDPVAVPPGGPTTGFVATRVPSQTTHAVTYDGTGQVVYRTRATTEFNTFSQPTRVDDRGDVSLTSDDLCTTTTYAHDSDEALQAAHLVALPALVETVAQTCGQDAERPDDVVSASRLTYDASGRPIQAETLDPDDGDGFIQVATTTYDTRGRTTETTDAAGNTTKTGYVHSPGGLVLDTVVTNPLGHTTTTTFDPVLGVPTGSTDANGRKTTATYDALGRITSVLLPQHATGSIPSVGYEYIVNPNGLNAVLTRTISADGKRQHASSVLYDAMLRPFQTQEEGRSTGGPSDLGRMVAHTNYDSAGRVVEQTEPWWVAGGVSATPQIQPADTSGHTTFEYDGAGRQTAQVFWVGTDSNPDYEKWRTTTRYDGATTTQIPPTGGVPTAVTVDARGRTATLTQYEGDPADQATTARETAYEYDPAGRLTGMTDPAGNEWAYGYDWAGRQITATDPDAGQTTTTYDVLGRVATRTNGNGQTLGYTYDPLGRTTSTRDGSPTGTVRASWEYDTVLKGMPASATRVVDGKSYVTRTDAYDTAYRPTQTSLVLPNTGVFTKLGTRTLTTKLGYTAAGQTASITYPAVTDTGKTVLGPETVTTVYDGATSMPSWMSGGFGWGVYVAASRYAADGRPLLTDLGNTYGAAVTYRYENGTKRLAGISLDRERIDGAELNLTYGYDPAGNVTSVKDAPTSPNRAGTGFQDNQCFSYDDLARLDTAWTPADGDCDPAPTAAGLGGGAPYWTAYEHDPLGNRTSQTVTTAAGISTTTTYGHGAGAAGPHAVTSAITAGETTTYEYDQAGNRTSAKTGDANRTGYQWDPEGELTTVGDVSNVYDADGNRIVRTDPTGTTIYTGGQEIRISSTGKVTGTRYYTFAGRLVAIRTDRGLGDGVTSIVADHHGTPVAAIRNGGHPTTTAVDRLYTDPYGATRGPSTAATIPGDAQFLGKTRDATGLTLLGARYYDEQAGAFISVDPILDLADPQQWNAYAYAGNNPLTRWDPSGLYASHCATKACVDKTGGVGTVAKTDKIVFPIISAEQIAAITEAMEVKQRIDRCGMSARALASGCALSESQREEAIETYVDVGMAMAPLPPIFNLGKLGKITALFSKGAKVSDEAALTAKTGDDVLRALSATERRTLDDALRPDKLDHIFDPKHNFQPLVQQFGSREAAMEQIVRSIGGPLPRAGRFEIAQNIGGQTVIIRGAVVDGIPRIGTAFTP